jgi:hypothetical protein
MLDRYRRSALALVVLGVAALLVMASLMFVFTLRIAQEDTVLTDR